MFLTYFVTHYIGNIQIPDSFHQWAINALKEEKMKEEDGRHELIQAHQDNLSLVNRKLETLLSMRLNEEIGQDEYLARKNQLVSEKAPLVEWVNDAEQRINTWIDRADELFDFAKQQRQNLKTEHPIKNGRFFSL
ncbi:hypothetical protein EBZ35_01440 [bacterium]|nr:hypothetical protein [bacterium]